MNGDKPTTDKKIIGKPDGPTAYFILSRNKKLTLKQRFQRWRHKIKKAWVARHISANPHTMDEVCEWLQTKHHFSETPKETEEYKREYREMRAGFMLQYAPELLGEQKEVPELQGHSEEEIKQYMEAIEARKQLAHQVPTENFDIEFRLFKKQMGDSEFHVLIEKRYAYIGGGASGSTKTVRKFGKIFKDIYRYYGVTQEDIDSKSKRYEDLIRRLASK